ncbi:MAG TPA: DUF4184 family protein [Flavobacterium alvei]|nr:DUF4184 family protein [Flavobacterium alvei]HQK39857.1 DUF4184 family protein [Flavobacterium alvei]
MPFTFSHPAIVLPLLRNKNLSATGLIIGSMSPDFEYFIRMKVESNISHTFLGLLFFDLPIGFLVALLFHQIIKRNLIENLPTFLQNRLATLKNMKWVDYLKMNLFYVLISILIGTISHILWDAFTHESGWFVQKMPFLSHQINNISLYKILQHLSSLIGMLFIFYYVHKLPVEKNTILKQYWKYWTLVFVLTFVFMSIRLGFGLSFNQIGNVVVSLISSIILAMTFAGNFKNNEVI